jgi:hypothetical protein
MIILRPAAIAKLVCTSAIGWVAAGPSNGTRKSQVLVLDGTRRSAMRPDPVDHVSAGGLNGVNRPGT